MVKLSNAIIQISPTETEQLSFSFNRGQINSIEYGNKKVFDFLMLKNKEIEEGEFVVDNQKFFSEEENNNDLLYLTINSIIKVGLAFIVQKDNKYNAIQNIQEQLLDLRELPSDTEEEKRAKIAAIFRKIIKLSPCYMLVDYNEKCNQECNDLPEILNSYSKKYIVITLEVKPYSIDLGEVKAQLPGLDVGNQVTETENDEAAEKDFLIFGDCKGNIFKNMWVTFKSNAMIFFSFLIPTIGVIAFTLLSPLYAKTSNSILILPFIITIVICFSLYMLMIYKCTIFVVNKNEIFKKEKRIVFYTINSIITLLGAGLGVVIYVLFKNFDSDLKVMTNNTLGFVFGIIIGLIMLTSCIYVTPIYTAIKSLFKRK